MTEMEKLLRLAGIDAKALKENTEPQTGDIVAKTVVGHVDSEAGMLRKELYKIGKYAVELHKMLGALPDGDLPHWWQSKIIKSGEYISAAKHYLEAELESKTNSEITENTLEEEISLGALGDVIGKLGGRVDKAKVAYYRKKDYPSKSTIEERAKGINKSMMSALEQYKKFEETGDVKFKLKAKELWQTATDSYEIVVDVYRPDAAQKLLAAGCLMPMKTHVQHKWEEMLLKFDEIKDAVGARIGDIKQMIGM